MRRSCNTGRQTFACLIALLGMTSLLSLTVSAQTLSAPTDLRVDISVGTTGQLLVFWQQVTGATYYNVERSTSPNSGYGAVSTCYGSGSGALKKFNTPNGGWEVCRDNNAGSLLTPGTTYYYEVQACDSSGCSANAVPQTSTSYYNIPITSDCTSTQIPSNRGLYPTYTPALLTTTVNPNAYFNPPPPNIEYEYVYYGYPTAGVARQNTLVVWLPGSDEETNLTNLLYTAQNLGFDVISVNYDSTVDQEQICSPANNSTVETAACFTNISQAKLNAAGPCSSSSTATEKECGLIPGSNPPVPYVIPNTYQDVTEGIETMLSYLNANGYNANGTNWGSYLSAATPNWRKIILAGHSQGGAMSMFTAYNEPIKRAIALSGATQADAVNDIMTAASYLSGTPKNGIRSIYGLVSQHDTTRYDTLPPNNTSVFQAVWTAMGFTSANDDAEYKLNVSGDLLPLNCNSGTPSNNLSTDALVNPSGTGHDDPLYLWNEDVYKFMLLDN